MLHNKIKNIFLSAVDSVIADPEQFAVNPAKDFSRQRKITPDTIISFLVSKGSSSSRVEMLDFGIWIRKCHPSPHSTSSARNSGPKR